MSDYASKHINCFNPSADIKKSDDKQKLYHYTSPSGLFAILRSGTIRFTDCQFLNDKSEYTHIREPLEHALKEIKDELYDDNVGEIINKYIDDNYELDAFKAYKPNAGSNSLSIRRLKMRYYVFCATDLADSLGMWNYYVKSGNYQGYNLIISVNNLLDCFTPIRNPDVDVFYGKVVYSKQDKVEILKSIIKKIDFEKRNKRKNANSADEYDIVHQESIGELLTYLEDYRLFFKNHSFASENEFRFIIRLPIDFDNVDDNVIKTGFEMKGGIITPYCELNINRASTFIGVTLSPMMESALAENGLRRFLTYYQYNDKLEIKQSRVPIRF